MSLDKFKFLTNDFINDKRLKKRMETLKGLQEAELKKKNISRKSQAKYKYISRLMLYNSMLDNASVMTYKKEDEFLKGADLLKCDENWPLCLYDHTYKNRCISYFAFRARNEEIIEDYFEEMKFGSKSVKVDIEKLKESGVKTQEQIYDSLMIERTKHYCTNKEFVEKMNKILELHGTIDSAFPSNLIEVPASDESCMLQVMENYVKHVLNLDFEEDEKYKEVFVGGTDQNDKPEKTAKKPKSVASSDSLSSNHDFVDNPESTKNKEELKVPSRKARMSSTKSVAMGNILVGEGLYSRRNLTMSFFLSKMADKMPYSNSEEIVAKSPAGKFIKEMVENQINM